MEIVDIHVFCVVILPLKMLFQIPFGPTRHGELQIVDKMADKLRIFFLPRIKKNILPSQQKSRPTLLLNPEKLLFRKYPSLFNYKIRIRPFAGLFLFNLAHHYEIISFIRGTPNEQKFIYDRLDPYGCISYRLNNEDVIINREPQKCVILQTDDDQWDDRYKMNILTVQEWNGKPDDKIFLLDQFLSNLLYVDTSTWNNTMSSYNNLPFFQCYNQVQKRIFHSRHFFLQNYDKFMKNVQDEKIREFENAKIIMDEQLRKQRALSDWITPIIGFLKTLLV